MFCKFAGLASSFTTKELLRRSFAKAKVLRYTDFFESAEQLLFGKISHGCFSMYIFTERRQLQSKNCMFKANNTKTRQTVKVYKVYKKDTGASELN